MKKYKNYINYTLERIHSNSVAIYTGELETNVKNYLSKYFIIAREPMGYTKFTKITA